MDRSRERHTSMAGSLGCSVANSKRAIDLDRVRFCDAGGDRLRYLAGDYQESSVWQALMRRHSIMRAILNIYIDGIGVRT